MSSQNGPEKNRNIGIKYPSLQKNAVGLKKRQVSTNVSKITSSNKDEFKENLKLGNKFFEKGELDKAEEYFKNALRLSPKNALPYKYLAITYFSKDLLDEALKMSLKEIEIRPNIKAVIRIGEISMSKGDLDTAILTFENLLTACPKNIQSLRYLSNLYAYLEKLDKASFYLEKIIKINPALPDTYLILADIYFRSGNYVKAEKNYLKYISFNLNDKKAYNNLGILYDKLEKYELAIDLFTKAIDLDPKLAAAYANMGAAHFKLDRLGIAEVMLNQAIFLNPCDIISYVNLFNLFLEQGRIKKAKEIIIKGLTINQNNKELLAALRYLNNQLNTRISPPRVSTIQ